jgi:hypothetical protein
MVRTTIARVSRRQKPVSCYECPREFGQSRCRSIGRLLTLLEVWTVASVIPSKDRKPFNAALADSMALA